MTIETRSMPIEHQARKTVDAPNPAKLASHLYPGSERCIKVLQICSFERFARSVAAISGMRRRISGASILESTIMNNILKATLLMAALGSGSAFAADLPGEAGHPAKADSYERHAQRGDGAHQGAHLKTRHGGHHADIPFADRKAAVLDRINGQISKLSVAAKCVEAAQGQEDLHTCLSDRGIKRDVRAFHRGEQPSRH